MATGAASSTIFLCKLIELMVSRSGKQSQHRNTSCTVSERDKSSELMLPIKILQPYHTAQIVEIFGKEGIRRS